ncbi:ABC transporter permease [Rhodococcus sp. BP-252]|nr:ABC transporter permease [Rhodococcus sp. BP-320]MBY6416517.1 ABC transporter permease [Rhodococcus sp. BP-321]MBY6420677.1 ABC transporter permease [Rhodococcus sp. BP-324]MBY6426541.1 ABC transporter permease [Rhodococcus sp. BP-323]MBY6431540.1 ABC transporter permease [Rhodococcus sp. BP-322]MBY6439919.1 ABC transporter permease [Rhodococcus sp. BP-319]MBY6445557.1 ABC transporter permease [Rhodococcus sp. BP-318]MBY6449592.1 ABC transporter permease [Rhodococcus sp. BP-315]MBY645497
MSGSVLRTAALWSASVVLGLAVWSFLAWWYGPTTMASPTAVVSAAKELSDSGVLWSSIQASAGRILIGWALGVVVGAPVGILMGRIDIVRQLLDPYIEFFRFIPPIAFVTLAVVWFGIGETSKIVLIFYTSVFIVTVSTIAATVAISDNKLQAAANLGAGRFQIMKTVVLPSTVPGIVTGARLAMGNSFLTIVSAEIVAANAGIGSMIWQARNYGRIDWTFVGIITLGIMGFLFDRILRTVSTRFLGKYGVK